ncbi:hypothetical protein [Micromonospora coerulea]|uniref:hypothetical protein n=1 Tax=Micromonospora coerulea TaxID=47856 RepID=UPI0019046EB5|nr:hypothetical protein [Micromonospora veneta]
MFVVLLLVGALLGVPGRAGAALAPPPNDAFAAAQVVTGTSGSVDGNIAGATTEPGEPGGDTAQPSIWYRWTAPQSGLYRFDATTGVFKPGMAIYTGTSLSTLQRPATDWCPPTAYDGAVYVLPAAAGTSYVISLTGYSANVAPGATTLRWGPHARPANDAFAAATVVTTLEPALAGDNCAATAESGEPLDEYTSRRTVWFSWTPGVTVREAVRDVPQHLIVTVYTGSSPGALTRVARSANVHGEYGTEFTAQVGITYRIQVDSQGNPPFGIVGPQPPFRVSMIKLPHCNDAFSCATGLTSGVPLPLSGSELTDNIGATAEAGEPAHAGSPASHSLWWQLTPPVGATVTVSTAGSGIDTVLAVYTGTTVDALTGVVADDDSAGSGASRVSFPGVGGRTYFVAVDGRSGVFGQVKLTWQLDIPAPPNDMFAAAIVINGAQGSSKSYTWSATKEAGEPAHEGAPGGRSVWWRYRASAAGRLHLVSSGDYTVLSVYRGSTVGTLTRVTGARQAGLAPIALDVDLVAGETYSIAVDVTDLVHGPDIAELTWSLFPPRPPNDYVANATLISGSSGTVDGHDVGATTSEVDEPLDSSVFYRWTAPSSGLYVFDTITSDFDTQLWIYRGWGTSLAPLPRVTINDNAVTLRDDPDDFRGVVGADHTSAAGFTAVAGQVYTILLAGPATMQGRFRLRWAPATSWRPPNDAFAAAQALTGGSGSVSGRLADSTVEVGEPGEAYGSIWYTWTAPASGPVRFWTGADPARHPLLSVYTGSTLSALTLLGENGYGIATPGSRLDLTVTAGTTYRIRLAAWDGSSVQWPGTATLRWEPPPPAPANDAFAAATAISGATGSVDGNSEWATREPAEPTGNGWPVASVWYRWTAPSSGSVSFWVTDGELYPMVDVYSGSAVNALTVAEQVSPGDEQVHPGARVTVRVTAGTIYAIQVQGSDYVNSRFRMLWSMLRPPHDDLASAAPLSGRAGVSPAGDWYATSLRATAETAEPRHDPDRAPAATVWFRWTAPASGPVTFEVGEANTTNMFAVYTGTGYGSLTQLGRTGWETWHDLRFDAVGGTSYLIVADGGPYGGGALRLRWSQYTDPTRPSGTVVVDGGASATAQRLVTLTLNATDNARVTGVRVSNSPAVDAWSDPSGNGGTQSVLRNAEDLDGNPAAVAWSLTDLYRGGTNDGGTKTVYAQWRDEQGNWSPVASDTIVANLPAIGDTLPPTGSVTINSGTSYTTSTSVSLSMPASDTGTGVSQVRISNRSDTSGGLLTYGAVREWTATPQSWSLADSAYGGSTANGTRSVYVQFRDGAGNWSPVQSDAIVLDTVAPAITAPVAVPATSSQVTSSVPTRVTWSATDATSGVAAHQLQQSMDGGTWTSISLPTALTTTVVRTLASGHTYRFRARSSDHAGLWSGWQYGPVLTPALYQETSTSLTWSGTWTRTALTGASGGYVRYSTQAGARATFTTSTRAVGWVAVRGPSRGKATVYVDGTAVTTVDLYASTVQPATLVYAYSWASTGTHTVVISVAGTSGRPRVDVDAIVSLR